MEEIFSKVVAIIIGCIALFIVPVKILSWRQENMQQTYILTETICFVDSVCNKGILYDDLYLDYIGRIQNTDKVYKINLQHIKNDDIETVKEENEKTSDNVNKPDEMSKQNADSEDKAYDSKYKMDTDNEKNEDIERKSYNADYTKQITAELESQGNHKFKENDIFRVEITDNDDNILVFYGGCIKDEDY